MESTIVCKSETGRGRIIVQVATTMFGVLLAVLMQRAGSGLLGWFLGGLVIGLGIIFAYKKPENRWSVSNMAIVTMSGVVAALFHYLFSR